MANGGHGAFSNEVLAQRLSSNEAGLKQLSEDTSRQLRDLATSTTGQITALAQDTTRQINGLAQNTAQQNSNLSTQISKLDNSLQERGKIQWPAFALLLSAITAIGWLAYNPINAAQTRVEMAQKEDRIAFTSALGKIVDGVPSRKEIDIAALRRDDYQRTSEKRDDAMEVTIKDLLEKIVPRGEHAEKWRSADALRIEDKRSTDLQVTNLQRQIDALRTDFAGLYSPRDALTSLQRRLEDVERRALLGLRPQSGS